MTTGNDQASAPGAAITPDQARHAVLTLIEAFDTLTNAGAVKVQEGSTELFTSVFGWWAWINNSAKVVLLAHDNGCCHEAAPNVRSILEHTVVMQWVIDDPETASAAISAKADNDRRKLFNDAKALDWTIPDDIVAPDPTKQTMLNFEALCTRYGAKTFSIPYRLLSTHVHPSAKGAEAYLNPDSLQLSSYAETQPGPDLVLIAICLIQSAQVINSLTADQPLAVAITLANADVGGAIQPLRRDCTR